MNGVYEINPLKDANVTEQDVLLGLLSMAGASVGGMSGEPGKSWCSQWEGFDPEEVKDPQALPDHWYAVWAKHNAPGMGDCISLRYRYVHAPIDILPSYPKMPCKGMFCLDNREIGWDDITGENLIHIDGEIALRQ